MNDLAAVEAEVRNLRRPHKNLLTQYALLSLLSLFLAPIVFLPLYFRYHTLRYRFDEEGISMRWGILFRREINLTYARVQDIHLRSNFVERWLNLARIEVQTASGSSGAEMTLEGLLEFEAIRDYLYTRMRGSRDQRGTASPTQSTSQQAGDAVQKELAETLRDVTAELRALRETLAGRERSNK